MKAKLVKENLKEGAMSDKRARKDQGLMGDRVLHQLNPEIKALIKKANYLMDKYEDVGSIDCVQYIDEEIQRAIYNG